MSRVMVAKPSVRAVRSSTDAAAYSRTNGLPTASPPSATRKIPRLDRGCIQRASTSSSTTNAATASSANTARLPTSRLRHG